MYGTRLKQSSQSADMYTGKKYQCKIKRDIQPQEWQDVSHRFSEIFNHSPGMSSPTAT